jgi:hypothetical protein
MPSRGTNETQELIRMQYLMSVIANEDNVVMATPEEDAAIDAFNEKMQANGNWVFAGGLGDTVAATTIDNRTGDAIVTDGPFVETKEFLAGFWVVEAPDLDAALKLAVEGSRACNRKVELRPFLQP